MKPVESLAEFITAVDDFCQHDDFFFRGQREDWDMVPKLARISPRNDAVSDEKLMLKEFRRHLKSFNLNPSNDWELLAIAQHHGMVTRLLDWTSSPLVALWFAIRKPATSGKNAVVYIFECDPSEHLVTDLENTKPDGKGTTKFFVPNIVTDRIRVQQGYFSSHKRSVKTKNWTALQKHQDYKSFLKRIEIRPEHFSSIRYSLDRCGINESTMFPDLDGMCKHITWSHTVDEDE